MFDLNPQFPNNQKQKTNYNFNNHSNFRHRFNGEGNGNVQFRLETTEENESGVCSPPLWRTNNSFSPPDSPVRYTNSRALSPASRALAIARGKKEMMEMVENMPETSYELSLKDMVDPRLEFLDKETQSMEEGEERSILHGQTESQRWKKNKKGSVKRQESNKMGRVIVKNTSMNNNNKGLLINMFFPFTIGSKRKSSITTSTSFGNNSNVKSSPKTELLEKSVDGDRSVWWWKKFTGSGDSESLGITSSSRSGSSGSSGSSGGGSLRSNSGSKKKDCVYGCWPFIQSTKKRP
ncbi:uncharacterized protein [Rutidosis leptorrhynchoides]|uniref:uncharacterized protein n=1 Tax=Rutidosis leptorrhynchoides TaxID=125765 RepID=UPI003A9A3023